MRVLFIEDDEGKERSVCEFLQIEFPELSVEVARSFNSGLRALGQSAGTFSLVLLDMTMPTFDASSHDSQPGTPEHFAGRDLLAQMRLRGIAVPTILLTMFDSFGEKNRALADLVGELSREYSSFFKGYVYYNATQERWKSALKTQISAAMQGAGR